MTDISYGNTSNLSEHELERADRCDHSMVDQALGVKFTRESDSFGTLDICIMCVECFEEAKVQDRLNHCYYCGEMKQTDQWRPYDFYAAQGDVPLEVCDNCWDEPQHQQRMDRDHRNYQEEMGYDNDY